MKKIISLFSFVLILSSSVLSQEAHICGTRQALEEYERNFPEFQAERDAALLESQYELPITAEQRALTVYIIPVVFHVIHEGGPENISDAQIKDAVRILNEDFRRLNSDANTVSSRFTAIDSEIEFRLAKRDESGNCHNGITRTYSSRTNYGDQTMKNIIQWDRKKYLNVWVSKVANKDEPNVVGYTYKPISVHYDEKRDGIVMKAEHTGSIGTSTYEKGRTLTHEVGHWLGLSHTWGDGSKGSCGTDNVSDTPATEGTFGCDRSKATCDGQIDNVENYMDYSLCPKMFSQGQKNKMRASLTKTTGNTHSYRYMLWSSSNLLATGVNDGALWLCKSEFSADKTEACAGEPITFTDNSYNDVSGRTWTFTGGNSNSTTSSSPTVTYNNPGVYNVSLTVNDGAGSSKSKTKNSYITVLPKDGAKSPYWESFESNSVPGDKWFISSDNKQWTANSSAAYGGGKSLSLINYSNSKDVVAEVLSSTIDLSTNATATITFKYAYAQRSTNNNDKLRLYVSNDCGENWSLMDVLSGISSLKTASTHTSSFVPNGKGEWKSRTKTISSSKLTEGFRFKFEATNDGGNNIYIDDIYISGTPVGINDIDQNPFSLKVYPNPVVGKANVEFELENNSHVTISVINLVGKEVYTIANRNFSTGRQQLSFNTDTISTGIYFVRITANGRDVVKKIVVK